MGISLRLRLVRAIDSFRISAPAPPELVDFTVKEALLPGTCSWNVQLLQFLVGEYDLKAIVNIPVLPEAGPDKLVWHFSNHGHYTVKSAYHLASSVTLDDSYKVEGQWGKLWKSDVPPKNLWHVFLFCPFAEDCWRASHLQAFISNIISGSDSFVMALFLIIGSSNEDVKTKVCMLFWQIWKERNAVVWNESNLVPSSSMVAAVVTCADWKLARSVAAHLSARQQPTAPCLGWHAIPADSVRCNVDAAFFEQDQTMEIGIVVRDNTGSFVAGKTMKMPGGRSVEEGELIGIKEALSWLKDLGHMKGIVESDSKRACEVISSGEKNILEIGAIASFCRREIRLFSDISIIHIKR
ncbi:uncharacterized protein LOC131023575 [Salvia miltiorrhiza]|uniref:uncharacterized protein LOC131023575 n=1 Tax=Salvia miltiorrhiza TaxID=226208 RepID=UPI0025AB6666|nr:uncharacterized protein LOC131023575 [Salvia miltiorrhiza]